MKQNRRKRGYHTNNLWKRAMQKKQGRLEYINGIPLHDLWDLDSTLGGIIASYLRAFKKVSCAVPAEFCGRLEDGADDGGKKWLEVLDKMIWSFEEYSNADGYFGEVSEEYDKKLQEGLELFAKYYYALWF